MFRKFIAKRKTRKLFKKLSSFVGSEEAQKILHDKPDLTHYRHGRIEFIVAFVRGENPEEISKRVGRVTGIAFAHGALNHGIIGAVVIVAFGTYPNPALKPKPEARLLTVQSLQQELTRDIKVVHGASDGHYGLFGGESVSYTFLVPQFDQVLGKLSQLEFGETAEFMPEAK